MDPMQNEQPAPAQAPGGAEPMPAGPMAGEMQQATPEEQQQYEELVAQSWNLIYDMKAFPKVVAMLKSGDPIEALASTAATIYTRVIESAKGAGRTFPGDVVFAAGREVFEDLADLSTKIKEHDFQSDPDGLERAFLLAADQMRVMLQQAGMLDQGAAEQDLMKLRDLDERGELEPMFRNLAGDGKQGDGQMPPPDQQPPPRGLGMGAQ